MEGYSSGTSRRSGPKDEFTDLLFSWSLHEIFDENLYEYQVEMIPDSFDGVDQYLASYVFPLLEETRAELASSLETAYKAPFAKVTHFKESKHEKLSYNVKVDHWRNIISDRGKELYRTLPGDFVLLSNSKPESVSDLERTGWTYTFASVINISEDESGGNCTFSDFKLKTAGKVEVGDLENGSLYVVYLINITTHKRIWNALRMRRNMRIIEKVLTRNDLGDKDCEFCPLNGNNEVQEKFGSTLLSKLNESQLEAVFASTSKIRCNHKSSVELVWGPPGTGKTTMLSSLLYVLLRMNVRTLVCAPTNIAITELASRVIKLVRNSVKTESVKSFSSYPLGDMLIFGNKDRLDVGSDIEEIFLDYRADTLLYYLVPHTGWRHCFAVMLDFLEDCVSHYKIFLVNEQIKAEHLNDEVQHSESKSFLDFVRDQFRHIASPLRRCIQTFCTHLPRSLISQLNFQSIAQLISLLDSIEMSLFEDSSMTSNSLKAIFLDKELIGSESLADTPSLKYMRSQCLSILRSVIASLNKLGLPIVTSRYSTTDFCFQKASLIFCTISSSYKLHTVDMEPFQLLVIDEAAQVKECETIIALQIPEVRHAILVGDEWQLPATVSSKLSEEAGFVRSLFGRLSSLGYSKHLLNVQYRMHPEISRFPNSNFYLNQILNAPNVLSESYQKRYLHGKMFGPYSFINVHGGREELDEVGHSRRNMVEVAVTVELVQKLFEAWNGSKEKLSVGLISPYAAQVAAIRAKLQGKYDNHESFTVKVKSVDGFQGGEEDVIIISTVRSHKGASVGFLSSPQRTNVALTRARHCLWILGNERTLSKSDSVWEALISDAKDRQCFFNAGEDCDIGKTVINAKKNLDQLEDLLSGESVLFKNSRWQVLFSENFRKSFQKLNFSSIRKLVINLLLKIASGWRPKNINVDRKCENSSYILKQFKVNAYYVVCSIDIIKDSIYKQVLKVWDILPMMETTVLFRRLDTMASMYTEDFINLCNYKLFRGNLEVPKSWPASGDIIRFKTPSNSKSNDDKNFSGVKSISYVENSKVSESLLLVKFYSLSSGAVNHLLSDHEGREIPLPFEVTDEEREMILFPRSCFVLGRSGTGKTTILTMKLYQKLHQYWMASHESMSTIKSVENRENVDFHEHSCESSGIPLRQLFVTVSPKLCNVVKKHVHQLISYATENFSGDNFTVMDDVDEMAEFKDIPDTFVGINLDLYPLIITFHKFLMMLDGTLGNSYFQRFPVVRNSSHYGGSRSVALQSFMRKNEVTYDRFSSLYWPRFNSKLTKILDPSRVFTEIMSHIKGSLRKGEGSDCRRSRDDYVSLSYSRLSTLCSEKRGLIYDIFEDYEKKKLVRGEFDLADFVNDIHLRLNNEDLLCEKMDFVYIDEVQDLTMRQISLFKYICKNVDEGFVFCGDTAQTIARGIDFRFEDIRSLFYNEFVMKSRECDLSDRREKGLISDMLKLSQNFRTHTGVLSLAQSVIDLICYYFPHSIDSLAPETSLIYGESPIVLEPGCNENLILSIFGHSGKGVGTWFGFGAEQVILVRDDTAKNEISGYIGHQALILTLVECKGLEFQDVLLYNFFGSSPMSNQWRVVYEFLKEKDLLDGDTPKSFPSFMQSKHNILCSELKQLYVAITRTRQRLWICENNVENSKPMLDYWRRLRLVQMRKMDDSLAEAMQRASSPEEWKSQGIKLFWAKHYEMAKSCFEKAGEETWEKRAKASGLRTAAETLRCSNSEEANAMLREAAEIFDSINKVESAVECFCDLGDYERAGRIYLEKCSMSELRKAGECFCLAGNYKTAAEVYAKGYFFRECLKSCTRGKYFDIGLQYIQYWKQQSSYSSVIMSQFKEIDIISQEFLENAALKSCMAKDIASEMKFVRAFHSMESKRHFLKTHDCLENLIVLEEELGNFKEAADVAKSIGDVLREISLLEKAEQFANASSLILSYVLSNSLWISGNRGWPLKPFPQKVELLNRAMSNAQNVSATFHISMRAESKMWLYEQMNLSELLHCHISSKQYNAPLSEVLSLRKLLDEHLQVSPLKYECDYELHLDQMSFNGRISRNQVSCGTLVYLWKLWKLETFKIIDCLDNLEKQDIIKSEGTTLFCLSYFGVRLQDGFSAIFQLMKPNAAWVNYVDKKVLRKNREVMSLEARHFASAAGKFWYRELVCVGLGVLEALNELYNSCLVNGLSKYYRSMCLLHIFDIAKFFLKSKSITMNSEEARRMQDFLQVSTKYFDFVFPLDPRESLSGNMISLRGTELSKRLLEEIVSRNISTRGELTYEQIGRLVMIMLGIGKHNHSLYDRVVGRFSKKISWKSFIEKLRGIMVSYSVNQSKKVTAIPLRGYQEDLSREFLKALEETYYFYQRSSDYISPNCFFYLLERLLFTVPHSKCFFFTSKSLFVEHLMNLSSNANPSVSFFTDTEYDPTSIVNFVATVVVQCLNDNCHTIEWIESSHINYDHYFPLLVLRLFVILCSLCLNWNFPLDTLLELMALPLVRSQLPREFHGALQCCRLNNTSVLASVIRAFKAIGDPLVIVASNVDKREFPYSDAIFLDLRSFSSKNEILKSLFPMRTEVVPDQPTTVERNDAKCSSIGVIPQSLETTPDMGKENMEIKWGLIREMSDVLEFFRNENDVLIKGLFLRKKVMVAEHIKFLTTAVVQWREKSDLLCDGTNMIEEFSSLSSLLNSSDFDYEALPEIGIAFKSFEARRPQLDKVLSQLTLKNDPNGAQNVSDEIVDNKIPDSTLTTEDEEDEDYSAAAVTCVSDHGC